MSTLSQFFGSTSNASCRGGTLNIFGTTGSMTIPATACEVAYGVIGGGGGSIYGCFCCATPRLGGAGGGFSYKDALLSCASSYTVCAVVGAGGNSTQGAPCGGNSCISGFSSGIICATGGQSTCGASCLSFSTCHCGGCGIGGDINNRGGNVYGINNFPTGGAGAGGLFGQGGSPGYTSTSSGGGGYGSGGGGGAGNSFNAQGRGGAGLGQDGGSRVASGTGGSQGGNGLAGIGGDYTYLGSASIYFTPAESGYIPSYTKQGTYSQGKTFLAAAGGGGAGGFGYGGQGAAGGGGGAPICGCTAGNGGFGGGGATHPFCTEAGGKGGIGAGGASRNFPSTQMICPVSGAESEGGSGIAIIEYWNE